ncbi:MAG: sulfotransferase family protein [Chloroflexi bacterium]|nr:sulfotransferase family protein [Chloroflexota bacterium]
MREEINSKDSTIPQDQTVIFLHIPKTAGITLNRIIDRQFNKEEIFHIHGDELILQEAGDTLKDVEIEIRNNLKLIRGHFQYGLHKHISQTASYFTLLRDPIERVISQYYYVKRDRDHLLHDKVENGKMGLDEYIESGITPEVNNGQTRLISGEDHLYAYGKCTPELLDLAKKNIQSHFSIVGLLERFEESLILLKLHYGWKKLYYVVRNVSQNRLPRSEISKDTIALIKKYNQLDIELYHYAKRQFESKVAEQKTLIDKERNKLALQNRIYRPYLEILKLPRRVKWKIDKYRRILFQ